MTHDKAGLLHQGYAHNNSFSTNLVKTNYVWMSKQLHHLYLLNHSLQVLIIKLCLLNDLYSHLHDNHHHYHH